MSAADRDAGGGPCAAATGRRPDSSSRTRLITICGSNGLTSTPSQPTSAGPILVQRLEGAGQQDHRNVRQPRIALDEGRDLVAVPLGHADIGEHDVRTIGAHPLDGLTAVADRDDVDVLVRERELDDPLDGDAVIGEQQLVGHGSYTCSMRGRTLAVMKSMMSCIGVPGRKIP